MAVEFEFDFSVPSDPSFLSLCRKEHQQLLHLEVKNKRLEKRINKKFAQTFKNAYRDYQQEK